MRHPNLTVPFFADAVLSAWHPLCAQGTAVCATCHPAIAATYARTGMARSFSRPQSIETARYFHAPSATWYSMEQRGDGYLQRRWRIGHDGKETDAQELPVDYVMGSGNHVRTFLSGTARGALVELPLAWYAEKGGYWAMNPGHDEPGSEPLCAGLFRKGLIASGVMALEGIMCGRRRQRGRRLKTSGRRF